MEMGTAQEQGEPSQIKAQEKRRRKFVAAVNERLGRRRDIKL
jgi:hypothetical protein